MMKRTMIFASACIIALLIATTASAAVITVDWGAGSDAATLESAFLSKYSSVTTEGFESFAANTEGSLTLSIGTLYGGGYVGDATTYQRGSGEYAVNGNNYWSNGTPNIGWGKNSYMLSFSTPAKAVGFYTTDLLDVGEQALVTVITSSGSVQYNLWDLIGSTDQADGTLHYFTFESDSPILSLVFTSTTQDGFGIDDVSVGTTPIPGAAWLFGTGLLGLIGYRRMRG